MQLSIGSCVAAVSVGLGVLTPAVAHPVLGTGVPCARTSIAAVKQPSGPAQYQSGKLTLANGASLRLQGTRAEIAMAKELTVGDSVAACYGPLRNYADAGPSRTITVLDLVDGAYYATLIGTWKPN
jgi:hypothetical protein